MVERRDGMVDWRGSCSSRKKPAGEAKSALLRSLLRYNMYSFGPTYLEVTPSDIVFPLPKATMKGRTPLSSWSTLSRAMTIATLGTPPYGPVGGIHL